jgi:hypothetical protein
MDFGDYGTRNDTGSNGLVYDSVDACYAGEDKVAAEYR